MGLNDAVVDEELRRNRAAYEYAVDKARKFKLIRKVFYFVWKTAGDCAPRLDGNGSDVSRPCSPEVRKGFRLCKGGQERRAAYMPAIPRWFIQNSNNFDQTFLYGKPIVGLDVHGHKGYVAGWGLTRNAECFTDNFGPERHARCRFPFIFNGKLNFVA